MTAGSAQELLQRVDADVRWDVHCNEDDELLVTGTGSDGYCASMWLVAAIDAERLVLAGRRLIARLRELSASGRGWPTVRMR